jgi:hypothetical protein
MFHGDLGNRNQIACLSWWLKEGVFTSLALWPGYWSRGCEDEFQHRYHAIMQQDPKHGLPRMSNHWQNALKFDKRSKQLHVANCAAAGEYLEWSGLLV